MRQYVDSNDASHPVALLQRQLSTGDCNKWRTVCRLKVSQENLTFAQLIVDAINRLSNDPVEFRIVPLLTDQESKQVRTSHA